MVTSCRSTRATGSSASSGRTGAVSAAATKLWQHDRPVLCRAGGAQRERVEAHRCLTSTFAVERRGRRALMPRRRCWRFTSAWTTEPGDDGLHRGPAVPDSDRAGTPALQPEEQAQLRDLFGEPERWGHTLRAAAVDACQRRRAPLHRHNHGRSAGAVHVRLQRRPPPSISTASTDGELPLCFLFSGTVFYRGPTARCRSRRSRGRRKRRFRLPVATWRDIDGRLLPEQRLALPAARRLRPAARLQSAARHSHLGAGDRKRCSTQRATRCRHERANASTAIAGAVLYEGYILYPYRPSAVKNRQRFNFGVLSPRDCRAVDPGVSSFMQTQCLAAVPGRALARSVFGVEARPDDLRPVPAPDHAAGASARPGRCASRPGHALPKASGRKPSNGRSRSLHRSAICAKDVVHWSFAFDAAS